MYYLNPVRSLVHADNSLGVNPPILVLQQQDASDKSSEKSMSTVYMYYPEIDYANLKGTLWTF